MEAAKLDLGWCDRRWKDPLTGTNVVCLSPDREAHFRNNYFRINMFTGDARYCVLIELEDLKEGAGCGRKHLWARDMISGQLRDLGELPDGVGQLNWAVGPSSHRVNIADYTDRDRPTILQVDIDTGQRRRIVPAEPVSIYGTVFSADERYIYTPWLKEKGSLRGRMNPTEYRAMLCAQPGYQEMVRIDLQTGSVEPLFSATAWWMGHPNPHPSNPDLFMCCQEWWGEQPQSKWGAASEHERIRVFDMRKKQWLDIHLRCPMQSTHEHWAPGGRRIYAHVAPGIHGVHFVNRIDLDTGQNDLFPCQPDTGHAAHATVAPNERFVVGSGQNFDRQNLTAELRAKLEALVTAEPSRRLWVDAKPYQSSGGETIWKYELPEKSLFDYDIHAQDKDRFFADLKADPEAAVKTSPICRYRSMCRSRLLGYRLDTNAHVTPDSRWAVFQSSSEDGWFEVWAARVPEAE